MIRKRLATLAAIAGLGLLSGCSSSSNMCCSTRSSFFSRLTGRTRTVEVMPATEQGGGMPCCDGGPALMDDRGPVVMPSLPGGFPQPPCSVPGAMPGFPGAMPGGAPLAPVPRLVPEPQAQARPYNP